MFIEINQRGKLSLLNLNHIIQIEDMKESGIKVFTSEGECLKFDIAYCDIANWLNENDLMDKID